MADSLKNAIDYDKLSFSTLTAKKAFAIASRTPLLFISFDSLIGPSPTNPTYSATKNQMIITT
jgi:hypothetical protein